MSTEDDRGFYTTGDSSTTQSFGPSSGGSSSFFDDDTSYSNAPTTNFSGFAETDPTEPETTPRSTRPEWHRGLDFGLLVLRLALGGLFVAHGLDKLFGWFTDAGGMNNTRELLSGFGFTEPGVLSWVVAVSETAGGVLVVLGLFFPAGAAAILAVMANVIVVKGDWNLFLGTVELEMIYAATAFGLLFTGPGRFALDRHTPWWRRAPLFGFVFLVIAAGLSVVTLVVWR
ncbi:DoxX family protein [Actinophytocola oryzae]|uniref:Putative oxidoreductase n=1 Tax=Actinophytocola oryzae TaxID=502181 RepID=A0A4R7VWU2_9PSEU|nr:DoxX family protein [Actinophytocola oryzae]TDV54118.1 putative oxidoreductase [Actinophytocola oryzae]